MIIKETSPVFVFTPASNWTPTDQFLNRLCNAYEFSSGRHGKPEGMWGNIDEKKEDIHAALVSRDLPVLRTLLTNPAETDLYYGMDTLSKFNMPYFNEGGGLRPLVEKIIVASMVLVSEVSGSRRFWNVERFPQRVQIDIEPLLADLDLAFGTKIIFPNPFPREFGLATSRGVIGHRVGYALYHALKARELSALAGGQKIVEIGAGVGRTAFYCHAMGLTNYTVVDLPMSLIGQACYLSAALGEDAIWLDGEPPLSGKIRLCGPDTFFGLGEDFDVALNVDSITEMPIAAGLSYLQYFATHARIIYSMNHEYNEHRTADIAKLAGILTPPVRHASSLREGYVEELFILSIESTHAAERKFTAIQQSTSWKITAPLRAAMLFLRGQSA